MTFRRIAVLATVVLAAFGCSGAQESDEGRIETVAVADGVYMLEGRGGNIGVSVGEDGVVLIDDQYAVVTEKIRQAVRRVSDQSIRFVLNTHWHGDHTGGNENFGKAGVLIVAHDNVRERMSVEHFIERWDRTIPVAPDEALPVVTFTETVTFHLNDEKIHAFHVAHAHTDGDIIVHFRRVDVLHMGDVYFNGMYPFIDVYSGGSIDGVIAAVDGVLELAGPETKIIPGHGPLSNREELLAYRAMLSGIRARIGSMIEAGQSLEEITAAKPTAELDEKWGQGFIKPDNFVSIVHESLSK